MNKEEYENLIEQYSNCVDELHESLNYKDKQLAELKAENERLINSFDELNSKYCSEMDKCISLQQQLKEKLENPHDVWVENNNLTEINNWQNNELIKLYKILNDIKNRLDAFENYHDEIPINGDLYIYLTDVNQLVLDLKNILKGEKEDV